MNLNLGSCDDIKTDCINVDKYKSRGVDVVHDLDVLPWPWKDDLFENILAFDIIEHLHNKINTMNECWRLLKNGGLLHILVPTTNGVSAFSDPTHVSYWNEYSFRYYIDGTEEYKRFAAPYGIKAKFHKIGSRLAYLKDDPGSGERLQITLQAIKPPNEQVGKLIGPLLTVTLPEPNWGTYPSPQKSK